MKAQQKGQYGESLAASHYRAAGYEIVAQNYRTRQGEIDLIASKNGMIVFIEVKTRSGHTMVAPREWVDANKQRKIILAARQFLSTLKNPEPPVRFDVVEVILQKSASPQVICIENAFES